MKYTEHMLFQYINTALWSSIDHCDEPFDKNYHYHDVDLAVIEQAKKDIAFFCAEAGELLDGLDDSQVAHDLWLTRNRHGAGFWDRGLGDVGQKLTQIAHCMGAVDLYVGDDGKVHG
jgi:hypothetical protein